MDLMKGLQMGQKYLDKPHKSKSPDKSPRP